MFESLDAKIQTFRVIPSLPEALSPLLELAHNLWWTWQPDVAALFERLDPPLWEQTGRNPVRLLGLLPQPTLDQAANDPAFVHAVRTAVERLRADLAKPSWFDSEFRDLPAPAGAEPVIAYFSAEFGLTESFQIYSGGLGCLAGDHLKSASELGVPLIGVGLLYRQGYFHQYLNADGWQQERFPDLDFATQPIQREIDPDTGRQRVVWLDLPGRRVAVGAWRCQVGRITLCLLDTNLEENDPRDRDITRRLYGGDVERRIEQELVLGIGGVRMLTALGRAPAVFHMNEGHSAFLALEHIRQLRAATDLSFDEALRATAASHVFTTHTPVPAGIDRFAPDLVERHLSPMLPELGLSMDGLLALGRENPADEHEFFSMAVLALKTSDRCNGVSRLHGRVSRSMWSRLWPGLPVDETPIGHVTNGVHIRSWVAPRMMELFDRHLGWAWQRDPADHTVWDDAGAIPDEELWRAHQAERASLITWVQRRLRGQLERRGLARADIESRVGALDPDVFTIGFARRFATYKRATLLLSQPERLLALLGDAERPVQILIAGKAHPADGPGKEMIRELVKFAESSPAAARVVFIEDYDIGVARRMVAGCDVWLNTPRRGLEASGTSGMKAAINGVINVSILDGWWDEAFGREMGFAVGSGETYEDPAEQDAVEGRAVFDLLERQILPEFHDRYESSVPRAWVQRMKHSIMAVAPFFNTNRMVSEYTRSLYVPAAGSTSALACDGYAGARDLSARLARLRQRWPGVRVEDARAQTGRSLPINASAPVEVVVRLGDLDPAEVRVQLYVGVVTGPGAMADPAVIDLNHAESLGDGRHRFTGEIHADRSGRLGYTARVVPRLDALSHTHPPGLISWFGGDDAAHRPAESLAAGHA
ncbi:MAG: glycosyltransferase family 1 protein [Planctomycetota bacterium]|nr:MAG: glycosyltransferase family 1 protein [Planctomycetota bacterium]